MHGEEVRRVKIIVICEVYKLSVGVYIIAEGHIVQPPTLQLITLRQREMYLCFVVVNCTITIVISLLTV